MFGLYMVIDRDVIMANSVNFFILFTNGRYMECLSLTYVTVKCKTQGKKETLCKS